MTSSFQSLRVLCADDEPAMRMVVAAHLRRRQHDVTLASDGVEAWAILSTDLAAFDVVVTDFDMPHLNGLGLVQILREAGYPGRIVVFSSSLTAADREKLHAFDVHALVQKGTSAVELITAVERSTADVPSTP